MELIKKKARTDKIKSKALFSWSISNALKTNGIPSPKE